jgi:hypothetical protein
VSRRFDEKYDGPPLAKCAALGLHPKPCPLGDGHHTEVPFSADDEKIGDALAYFLGTMYSDVDDDDDYWYRKRTSVDEWRRVARALRIHGLRIADDSNRGGFLCTKRKGSPTARARKSGVGGSRGCNGKG